MTFDGCLGGAVVERRTCGRKVAGSTPYKEIKGGAHGTLSVSLHYVLAVCLSVCLYISLQVGVSIVQLRTSYRQYDRLSQQQLSFLLL